MTTSGHERHPANVPSKVEPNRQNALKSTGPKDTTSIRHNAVKHGLLAERVTELADPTRHRDLLAGLRTECKPVGIVETFVVERMTLEMLRVQRACRLEAEHITAALIPPMTKVEGSLAGRYADLVGRTVVLDPGLSAPQSAATVEELDNFTRSETLHENRLHRAANELRQMQRDGQIEQSPATAPAPAPSAVGSSGHPPAMPPATP